VLRLARNQQADLSAARQDRRFIDKSPRAAPRTRAEFLGADECRRLPKRVFALRLHVPIRTFGRTMETITQLNEALAPGYQIEREIGAGGTATVYLARDLKHQRTVAVKVLKPDLAASLGPERFLNEIRLTATLQHPNLLPLFDSGQAGGVLFYVMPYIDGQSLRQRIDREKQLPVDDTIRIATGVANALDYVHRHGVVHRDLKPENILLHDGQPLVADFGIARALSNAAGGRLTQTGVSLGTPQYMSPEQATGDRDVDARTDVYALGAVTYEMLTGDPPHTARTAQAVIAQILTQRPRSMRVQRPSVPEAVDATVARALEKLPADRWSTAREFADALGTRSSVLLPAATRHRGRVASRLRDPVVILLGAGLIAVTVAVLMLSGHLRRSATPPRYAFQVAPPAGVHPVAALSWGATLSPNGRLVVFLGETAPGKSQLFARPIDELESRPITGTENAIEPVISPDGEWIAFQAETSLKKIRLDGSGATTLAPKWSNNGLDWGNNNVLVVGGDRTHQGLWSVSASGGAPTILTRVDSAKGESAHRWPIMLDDGKTVLFSVWYRTGGPGRLAVTSLRDGRVRLLGIEGNVPLGVVDDQLLFLDGDGVVNAVTTDRGLNRPLQRPVPVLEGVAVCQTCFGDASIRLSRSGSLVYLQQSTASRLTWVDSSGIETPAFDEPREFSYPRISPDGKRIAATINNTYRYSVWVYEIANKTLSRLGDGAAPEWTADSREVLYHSAKESQNAYFRQPADGRGPRVEVLAGSDQSWGAMLSPDGTHLLYLAADERRSDIVVADMRGGGKPSPFVSTPAFERGARWSPDGRHVVYVSDESGRREVYVRSFPDTAARVQVSVDGGSAPVWAPDGNRIYYFNVARFMAADLATSPWFRVSGRKLIFDRSNAQFDPFLPNYDVGRGKSPFLFLKPAKPDAEISVIVNWADKLREMKPKR
jgi:serine/threonine-protein kinase